MKQDGDNLLIGPDEDNMELFSRNESINPDYVIKNDEKFQLPVFKSDSAWYKGYLRGYNPKMGTTGMVYVNNILATGQESYLITINPDGSFSAGFPMLYPQPVYVKLLSRMESIYFEPGETTFQCIDVTQNKVEREYRFMGNTARINNDLVEMESIRHFNFQEMKDSILNMSPEEYKTYCKDVENSEMAALNEIVQNNPICKKVAQIKEMQIQFSAWQNILSYNMNRISAYRQINKVPRDQREIPLERVDLTKDFFDFIDVDKLNNPLAVVAGGDYYFLINRIKFADPVRPRGPIAGNIMGEVFRGFESRKIESAPSNEEYVVKTF